MASPAAAAIASRLGFRTVLPVPPGQMVSASGLDFRATVGALVGPPWSTRENGFFVEERSPPGGKPLRLYYEPHLDYDAASVRGCDLPSQPSPSQPMQRCVGLSCCASARVAAGGEVDVVVAPCTAVLMGGYPLVQGSAANVAELLRLLKPQAGPP